MTPSPDEVTALVETLERLDYEHRALHHIGQGCYRCKAAAEITRLQAERDGVRGKALREAATVANNLDAGVVAYHIETLNSPPADMGEDG